MSGRTRAALVVGVYFAASLSFLVLSEWALRRGANDDTARVVARLLNITLGGFIVSLLVRRMLRDRRAIEVRERALREEERRMRVAAEHAAGLLAFEGRASEVLAAGGDDVDATLLGLCHVLTASFADAACIVDASGRLVAESASGSTAVALGGLTAERRWRMLLAQTAARPPRLLTPDVRPSGPVEEQLVAVGAASVVRTPIAPTASAALVLLAARGATAPAYGQADLDALREVARRAAATIERAALHRAVVHERARLGAIVASSPVAIVELTADGAVAAMNPAARDLFGSDVAAATADVRTWLAGQREHILRDGRLVAQDLATRRGDGTPVDLSVSVAPLAGDDDDVHFLVLLTDVTEQRRLAQQVDQNQRLEALGRMAGAVAHDCNNLLTVILGHTELVLRRPTLDDRSRSDLESVRLAGEQVRDLAAQLLTLSRRSVVHPEVVDPGVATASLLPVFRRLAGNRVDVELEVGAASGVLISPGQLNQVLLNLVMNAVDAMPDGGKLAIRVHDDVASNGDVAAAGAVVVDVTDDGVGMDRHIRDHCFEPFFTTKQRSGGTGLGLATAHAIVTGAGGDIHVSSTPGAGTTFTVKLPTVSLPDGAVRHDEAASPPAPIPAMRGVVLLVEDDEQVRSLARSVLAEAGYEVVQAASGPEALVVAERHGALDVVVTDVVMPGMTGVELARRLDDLLPGTPVLLVSGYAEDPAVRDVGSTYRFLEKPYHPDALLRAVREAAAATPPAVGGLNR